MLKPDAPHPNHTEIGGFALVWMMEKILKRIYCYSSKKSLRLIIVFWTTLNTVLLQYSNTVVNIITL